jgi:hypothetical protein
MSSAATTATASGKVSGAFGRAGSLMGGTFGKAFLLAAVFAIAAIADEIWPVVSKASRDLHDQIFGPEGPLGGIGEGLRDVGEWLNDLPWPLGPKGAPDWAGGAAATEAGIQQVIDPIKRAEAAARRDAEGIPRGVQSGLAAGQGTVTAGAETMVDGIPGAVDEAAIDAGDAAAMVPTEIAAGILEQQNVVGQAMAALRNQIENEKTPAAQASATIGALISTELANAMNDKREGVRLVAQNTRELAEAELAQFIAAGGEIGKKGMEALIAAEKSKDPDVAAAARRTRQIIETTIKPNTKPAGVKAGQGVVTGLNTQSGPVGTAATNLGRKIARNILGGILYQGGGRAAKDDAYVPPKRHSGGPGVAGMPYLVGRTGAEELFVPETHGQFVPGHVTEAASIGGADSQVSIQTYGLPMRAETPAEVVHQVRRAARLGSIVPPRKAPAWRTG